MLEEAKAKRGRTQIEKITIKAKLVVPVDARAQAAAERGRLALKQDELPHAPGKRPVKSGAPGKKPFQPETKTDISSIAGAKAPSDSAKDNQQSEELEWVVKLHVENERLKNSLAGAMRALRATREENARLNTALTELETTEADMSVYKTHQDMFEAYHGGKMLHGGVRRTWLLLNKIFPEHKIPIRRIADMVDECAVWQKFRRGMSDALKPVEKYLKPEHAYEGSNCGIRKVIRCKFRVNT